MSATTSTTPPAIERRTVHVGELRTEGNRLVGHAAVFDSPSGDLGGFTERIVPGAFAEVLDQAPDVHLLLNHDENSVLARTAAGTLRLREDARGLAFDADLPESPLGENVRESVRRGDISGASFRFVVASESWDGDQRTIRRVGELRDVTVATRGAYPAARVELRADTPPTTTTTPAEPDAKETEAMPATTEPTPAATGSLAVEDRAATPAETERPVEERIVDAIRAVPRGESRALTTAASISPGELSAFLFDRLRAASVALASGLTVIPTEKDSVVFPTLTADVTPGWYAEAATLTAGDPTFASITATPKKLAHLIQVSNEVIEDSDPAVLDVLNAHLIAVLGLKLDAGIFEGSGSGAEITGLKNVAGIGSVSMGTNGGTIANLDPIADAIQALEAANAKAGAIALAPRTWNQIRKLKDSQNRPLVNAGTADTPPNIYGVRVFVSAQLSITESQGTATSQCSSIYVYAPEQVVLIRRKDVQVEVDRSRLFNSDQSEVRARGRFDLIVPNPTAVARVVGLKP